LQQAHLTFRLDGFFVEFSLDEGDACTDSEPAIDQEEALEIAAPVIRMMSVIERKPPTMQLAYVIAHITPVEHLLRPEDFQGKTASVPRTNRLVWVVSVSSGWHPDEDLNQVWVDAKSGRILEVFSHY
jgi:hypothetical protein